MEEPIKEEAADVLSGNSAKPKLQKYGLRSAVKSKEDKQTPVDLSNSSAAKRGRPGSSVSKSVGVLDLSGKDKSAKPPRRLSIPTKSSVTPTGTLAGNITPISETRTRRSANGQSKTETPVSDLARSTGRKKFRSLSSASYWLSQIKLSESAVKHSISLGFFKLALEAGCEPLQRMRDELKSYACRHQLGELGVLLKELLESYNISENTEQKQVSETCSQVPEEGTRSSDDDVHNSLSTMGTGKLKPKCLNVDSAQLHPVTESAKETSQKANPTSGVRGKLNRRTADSKSVSDATPTRKSLRNSEKPIKQEANKDKGKIKKQGNNFDAEGVPTSPLCAEDTVQGNKQNMDSLFMEEINLAEIETSVHA
ncbi:microtubule-associated protein futsch-like isoform X2 [Quillaja saponaria]|uniref:Microtubule-associated protein futsch-like isoform X2 n=1 Tax=Quillaja saponaria TaxID=32244 RepID=A0AAD7PIV6_QUISA|nr:microtubule-associated protein futsch-like isoform X2 [Quillaja saponaria]